MPEPTPAEFGPLLGESAPLDEPAADPYEGENSAFMSAAKAAVGGDMQATALRDAIEAYCIEKGLIGGPADDEEEGEVGEGFPDF